MARMYDDIQLDLHDIMCKDEGITEWQTGQENIKQKQEATTFLTPGDSEI
jgi:hypothetical protein